MKNALNYLASKEEELILLEIQKYFFNKKDGFKPISSEQISVINANLLQTDDNNIAFKVHKLLSQSLIYTYIVSRFPNYIDELKEVFSLINNVSVDEHISNYVSEIPFLLEELHILFLNSKFQINNGKLIRTKSKHYLRESGAVYTLSNISKEIIESTINNAIAEGTYISDITCLDFACGTGRFYFEAFLILKEKYNISLKHIVTKNLYAVDNDEVALFILRCKVLSYFKNIDTDILKALSYNILNRNALIPASTLLFEKNNGLNFAADFKTALSQDGFDVVFSNPPYLLLKVNRRKSKSQSNSDYYDNLYNKIQNEMNFFRNSDLYKHSVEGMLNYYKLSIEMILRLTKNKGQIGIICPASLFGDISSTKLRKHILNSNKLSFIRYYPESARLFENVSQSTVIFNMQKNGKTDKIRIEVNQNKFDVDFKIIQKIFPDSYEVPLIDATGWRILKKISEQKKLKEISFLRNRRGELDLSLNKSFITDHDTGWRLVRGNMINDKGIINKNGEYVEINGFLDKKSDDYKKNDFNKKRIICQQVSNIDMHKRLKFVFAEKTDILGNSCNYITSTRKKEDLSKLYFLLNSELLNWRFKITSTNNHINNYELAELPILDLDSFDIDNLIKDTDQTICKLYGLDKKEINYILDTVKLNEE